MENRTYHGIKLSKKESELMQFLQTGSNQFEKAFYIYPHRKKSIRRDLRVISSWFNRTLLRIHKKNIALNIPFVWDGIKWINPGVEASKANLVMEQKIEHIKELTAQKPVL